MNTNLFSNPWITDFTVSEPALQGFITPNIAIDIVNHIEYFSPKCENGHVKIHSKTPTNTLNTSIDMAYALQFATLTQKTSEKTLVKHLACEILAKHFSLYFWNTWDTTKKEQYKTIIKNESEREYTLLCDYEKLVTHDASHIQIAHMLGSYLCTDYQDNNRDIKNSIDQAINLATPALFLAIPTHILMTHGGDDRLLVCPEKKVNKYLTAPIPTNDIISRSSSTTSFPTHEAFYKTEKLRNDLIVATIENKLNHMFTSCMHKVRTNITRELDLSSDTHVIVTPSGTTSEIVFNLLALARYDKQQNKKISNHNYPHILNIVTAAGEVGSGSALAASCKHFSPLVPRGSTVPNKSLINGVPEHAIEMLELPGRNKHSGKLENEKELEEKIKKILDEAITQKNQIAILHFVDASKTGYATPTLAFTKRMKERYGQSLIIVVDAAQIRCKKSMLQEYLDNDFCVFITGSKFFAGTSFCGAVLLPENESHEFKDNNLTVPEGFGDYLTQSDITPKLTSLAQKLPGWKNAGLLLRWTVALHNMHMFNTLESKHTDTIIQDWAHGVKKLALQTEHIELLEDHGPNFYTPDNTIMLAGKNTIIPILFKPKNHTHKLTNQDIKKVHLWLTKDLSQNLPPEATSHEKNILSQKFLIGQPVKLADSEKELNILRIALSAPMVNNMAQKTIQEELTHDKALLEKLSIIGKYYSVFENNLKTT